jgi:hypothetical protein
VVPGLGREALESGEPRCGEVPLGARRGEIAAKDRVERDVIELDGLNAVSRARRYRRSVEQGDGDDENAAGQ